jgi:hypothetical protein
MFFALGPAVAARFAAASARTFRNDKGCRAMGGDVMHSAAQ